MMKSTLIALFALFTLSACITNEPDDGNWSGHARYSDDFGNAVSCSNVQVNIEHEDDLFKIEKSISNCNLPSYMWRADNLFLHNNRIYQAGEVLGRVEGVGAGRMEIYDFHRKVRVFLNWQRSGTELVYSEEVHGAGYAYKITGVLQRTYRR